MRQVLSIKELPPDMNHMLRGHWGKRHRDKKTWAWLIKAEKPEPHEGPVKITYTRVSTQPMDLDNVGGSFKVIGDGLVRCGIIEDDSPDILQELVVRWQKAESLIEQGVIIEIEDVE